MLRLITLMLLLFASHAICANDLITLCYHDVRDDVVGILDEDQTAVSSKNLANQFAWLKEHDYHVVSLQDVVDAQAGLKKLPPKAILLTFDDGYRSFYTRIYPLLKLFNYPAVFALATKWLEATANNKVLYGQSYRDRGDFLTWDKIRIMSASGLIEFASHSHNLHRGIRGNPQGNLQPAMITRLYDPKTGYESDADYKARIYKDLKQSSDIIYQQIKQRPRAIVWPYGAFNQQSQEIALQLGMSIGLTLQDHKKNQPLNLAQIPRYLISENASIATFAHAIRQPYDEDNAIHRVAHIDIDTIYDPDDAQQTLRNLDGLLDRIKAMKINTVYLQAFADPDGDGNADAVYFPNRHLPMRADLFNRIAWQLRTRAGVTVYAWLPVTAFHFKTIPPLWKVKQWRQGSPQAATNNYQRLSFFNPEVKKIIGEIYQDIAKYSNFGGLLFHDDALLGDYEDASVFAEQYAQAHQLPPFKRLYENRAQRIRWAKIKTDALIEFTDYLAHQVRLYHPEIKTARNIYAQPVINPETEEWYAQSFVKFLQHYDYTAIMAMPYMENAQDPTEWLKNLITQVASYPNGFKKTIFELQTVNWKTSKKIPNEILEQQMRLLMRKGAIQFGYYPDDSIKNHPQLKMLQRTISLQTFPYGD